MSVEIVKCPVPGCRKKLDSNNIPIDFCDYQQGRCPMYPKTEFTFLAAMIYVSILIVLFGVICFTM
jgi:hypothetical protein